MFLSKGANKEVNSGCGKKLAYFYVHTARVKMIVFEEWENNQT